MVDVLTKPVRSKAILETVQRWMPKHESRPGDGDVEVDGLAVYDPGTALEQFGGNKALLDSSLAQLRSHLVKQLEVLRAMVAEGRLDALRAEAHRLKGGAAAVTAMALSAVAAEMEAVATEGKTEGIEALLDRMESEFSRFRDHIGFT